MRPLLLLLLSATAALAGRDWPAFRGPAGDGHSAATNVPVAWTATSNVAWKVAVPGRGWSSPVVAAGRLYLTAAIPGEGDRLDLAALALDASTGRELWRTAVIRQDGAAPGIHRKNSHASPTPIVADGRLYVHFGHRGTACLDLEGKVLWRQTALEYPPFHGNGGTPVLWRDLLIYSADATENPFVVALDTATGEVRWKVPRVTDHPRKFSFSTPTVIEIAGRPQLISPGSGVVDALDPATGAGIWRARYDGFSVIPKPVFGHGLVFVGTGYEAPTAIAIRVDGAAGDVTDTHVAWTLRRSAPNTPSFLLVGDELYLLADSGVMSCVDARTGTVHWQERVCGGASASPVLAGGRIYVQDEQGKGVVLSAGKEFRKLAENPLGERTLASYAVTDGALFIRSEENLFRIGARP
ncbi:MAG: PQQ-binding-like beta-propeller repeat protein [Limisphaerales bacterium]